MTKFFEYYNSIKLIEFPEFRQTYHYDCGANALLSILAYYNIDLFEEDIMKMAGTDEESGTPIRGLKKVLDKYKIDHREGTFTVEDLKNNIDDGNPTLIMLQAWPYKEKSDWKNEWDQGHYVIAIGYDYKKIYFEDPISIKRSYLTFEDLQDRWHGWDDDDNKIYNWGIVITKNTNYRHNETMKMESKNINIGEKYLLGETNAF